MKNFATSLLRKSKKLSFSSASLEAGRKWWTNIGDRANTTPPPPQTRWPSRKNIEERRPRTVRRYFFKTLLDPKVQEDPLSVPGFYFMYIIWQDARIRTRAAVTADRGVLPSYTHPLIHRYMFGSWTKNVFVKRRKKICRIKRPFYIRDTAG